MMGEIETLELPGFESGSFENRSAIGGRWLGDGSHKIVFSMI